MHQPAITVCSGLPHPTQQVQIQNSPLRTWASWETLQGHNTPFISDGYERIKSLLVHYSILLVNKSNDSCYVLSKVYLTTCLKHAPKFIEESTAVGTMNSAKFLWIHISKSENYRDFILWAKCCEAFFAIFKMLFLVRKFESMQKIWRLRSLRLKTKFTLLGFQWRYFITVPKTGDMMNIYKLSHVDFKRGQYFIQTLELHLEGTLLLWRRAFIDSQKFLLEKDDDICRSLCYAGLLTARGAEI